MARNTDPTLMQFLRLDELVLPGQGSRFAQPSA